MKHKQPTLYKIITSSLENKSLSHAYLLVGDAFLLETALWLGSVMMSQSLDNSVLIETREQMMATQGIDFVLIDGSSAQIKKDDILSLQEKFKKTALQVSNQKVVIIHQVHNANHHALNSILKFLEEPSGSTTRFILTTDTIGRVMPTILSRCVIISLDKVKAEEWHLETGQHSIIEDHLKKVCSTLEEAETLLANKSYQLAINISVDLFETLPNNVDLALVQWQLATINDREMLKYVIDISIEHCRALLYNRDRKNPFSLAQLEGIMKSFNTLKAKLNPSVHVNLLVDEGCYLLQEVFYVK